MSIIFNTDFGDDKYNKINKGLTMLTKLYHEYGDPKASLKVSFNDSPETLRVFLGEEDSPDNLLVPLYTTGGKLVFPYTPVVRLENQTRYNQNKFVHGVYDQHTYSNTSVESITIDSTFTAQSNYEARYMLAAIHFFRIMSKGQFGVGLRANTVAHILDVSNEANVGLIVSNKVSRLDLETYESKPENYIIDGDSDSKKERLSVLNGLYHNQYRGLTPPVLSFNYLGKLMFKDVPLIITNVLYDFPNDIDYVPVRTNRPLVDYVPARMKIMITLKVQYNPMKLKYEYDMSSMKDARYLEGTRQGYI